MRILSFVFASVLVILGISCASHRSGMTFQSGQSKKTLIKEKISLASSLYDTGEIDAAIATLNELIGTQRYTEELSEAFENLVHYYLLNGQRKKAKIVAGQFMRLHWQSPRAQKIQGLFDQYKHVDDGMYSPVEKSEEVIEHPGQVPPSPVEAPFPPHEEPVEALPLHHDEVHHPDAVLPPSTPPAPEQPAAASPEPTEPKISTPKPEHDAPAPAPAPATPAPANAATPASAPSNPTTPAIKEEAVPLEQPNKHLDATEQKLPEGGAQGPSSHELFLDKEGHLHGNNPQENIVK